jgi:hypothetical protein
MCCQCAISLLSMQFMHTARSTTHWVVNDFTLGVLVCSTYAAHGRYRLTVTYCCIVVKQSCRHICYKLHIYCIALLLLLSRSVLNCLLTLHALTLCCICVYMSTNIALLLLLLIQGCIRLYSYYCMHW